MEISREVFVAEDGTLMFADLTHDEGDDYFIVGIQLREFSEMDDAYDYGELYPEHHFDWILREPQWL